MVVYIVQLLRWVHSIYKSTYKSNESQKTIVLRLSLYYDIYTDQRGGVK